MILIVDDDPSVTSSLSLLFKQQGMPSHVEHTPAGALAWLQTHACRLVVQDMNFSRQTSGAEGLDLLERIRAAQPDLPVVLITAWGSIALAVEGMKRGAADFITKPWSNPQVLHVVHTTLGLAETALAAAREAVSRDDLDARHDFSQIVGADPRLLRALDTIGRVAPTDAPILITGESGTGKELVADAIHRNSQRRRQPFVKVNLGGVATSLFESEMFGHVRGAFTDAKADRKGRFALAHGGTIFLDEIGDLDLSAQVKLLRVLQDRTFEVLGSSQRVTVDVRVVCATNGLLADMVARGEFREDLLYRVNLISLHLPPLRERRGDIPVLAERFLRVIEQVYRREGLQLSADAVRWLQQQPWPGNIRELRQAIERAVLVTGKSALAAADFSALAERPDADAVADALPPVGAMTIDEIEKAMILKALSHHGGNLSRVATALGLSRPALYRRLDKHEIAV